MKDKVIMERKKGEEKVRYRNKKHSYNNQWGSRKGFCIGKKEV